MTSSIERRRVVCQYIGNSLNGTTLFVIIYGHKFLTGPPCFSSFPQFAPSPISTNESTLNPRGSGCPGSNSTSVSNIFVSTCSEGSSVRTFFFPRIRPTRIAWPRNFRVPNASAITYARCPTFNFETSLFIHIEPHPQRRVVRHRDYRRIESASPQTAVCRETDSAWPRGPSRRLPFPLRIAPIKSNTAR